MLPLLSDLSLLFQIQLHVILTVFLFKCKVDYFLVLNYTLIIFQRIRINKMNSNYIYKQIRRISLINLTIPAVLAILVVLMYINIPFGDILHPKQLDNTLDADSMYADDVRFVNASFDKLYYTGYDYIKNGKTAGYYYYTLDEGKCTFVLVDSDNIKEPKDTITGYSMNASLEKQNDLIKKMISGFSKNLDWTNDGLLSVTSLCFIDETGFNSSMYVFFGVCLFILTVLLFSYLIINIIYLIAPGLDPACLKIKKITGSLRCLIQADAEINNPDAIVFSSKKIILTDNYLFYRGIFDIDVIPVQAINKIQKTAHSFLKNGCTVSFTCTHKSKFYIPYVKNSDFNNIKNCLDKYNITFT